MYPQCRRSKANTVLPKALHCAPSENDRLNTKITDVETRLIQTQLEKSNQHASCQDIISELKKDIERIKQERDKILIDRVSFMNEREVERERLFRTELEAKNLKCREEVDEMRSCLNVKEKLVSTK